MDNVNAAAPLFDLAREGVEKRHDAGGALFYFYPDANTFVISCSGLVPENQIIYAMENSSARYNHNKLFLCDRHSAWYYKGIEGITSSFDETVDFVAAMMARYPSASTCAIGTSAGGYLALALAARLGLDRALAFSPQTTLEPAGLAAVGEDRWSANMSIINAIGTPYDIRDLIGSSKRGKYFVVYPSADRRDALHAQRLAGLDRVFLYEFATDDHNVAAALFAAKLFHPCLDAVIYDPEAGLDQTLRRLLEAR